MSSSDPRVKHLDYICSGCGTTCDREALFAKQVQFTTIGRGRKILKSRTVGWYCEKCMNHDPDWTRPAMAASPGMKGTKIAAVR